MTHKYYQMKEVAKLLSVKPYKINYALVNGHVQEPQMRIANTRVFTTADIQALAQHFNVAVHAGTERRIDE